MTFDFMEVISTKEYKEAAAFFEKSDIDSRLIEEEWDNIHKRWGKLIDYRIIDQPKNNYQSVQLKFEKKEVIAKVFFNRNKKIIKVNYKIPPVQFEELDKVVKSNLITFKEGCFPEELINRLVNKSVVIFGEYHYVVEEQRTAAKLLTKLNQTASYDQLLLETGIAYSWIFQEYSLGNIPKLPDFMGNYYGEILSLIQEYNKSAKKKIIVRSIDRTSSKIGYINSLGYMMGHLQLRGTRLEEYYNDFLDDKYNAEYNKILTKFRQDLTADRKYYLSIMNQKFYNYLDLMTENELRSLEIRKKFSRSYTTGFKAREELMKDMSDYYIKNNSGGTMIYIGAYHAQKKYFKGTRQEWLGDYLANRSKITSGESYSLVGVPLKGRIKWGTKNYNKKFNIAESLYKDELFLIASNYTKNDYGFLPLEDPIFKKDIMINEIISRRVLPPAEEFDGYIIIPEATTFYPSN